MNRTVQVMGASRVLALAAVASPTVAHADPPTVYQFAACYDPTQPAVERPTTVVYGCDHSSVMENMTWTTWGADGAIGAGVDNAVECRPNCAQGRRLVNPIVVHASNPAPADQPGCPAGVEFYRDVTVAYPEGVPPWVQPGTSWTEDVSYVRIDGLPAVHFSNQTPYSCLPPSF